MQIPGLLLFSLVLALIADSENCQDHLSPGTKPEFSRNPSTTTLILNPPTTPHVTSLKTTPQWNPNILASTEQETSTPSKSIVHHDPRKGEGDEHSRPSEHTDAIDSKMKNMKTAIISLILIVFALVGAGTGVYCQRKKPLCVGKSVAYTPAPSQDTIEMERTPDNV